MKLPLQKKHKRFLHLFIVFFLFIAIFIMNYYTPLYADDYSYSYSFATDNRLVTIEEIPSSQLAHYYKINGRSIVHAIAQLNLLLGDSFFNVFGSLALLGLAYLLYYHSFGAWKPFSLSSFLILFSLLFLCTPAFGQSFLWITGSANYLFGPLIILLFLLPYRKHEKHSHQAVQNIFIEIMQAVLFFPCGVVAGWTNENTAVAMIIMIFLFLLYSKQDSQPFRAWQITGFVGAIVGCTLMLIAPGNRNRLNTVGGTGGVFAWIKRFVFITCDGFSYLHISIIFLVILATLVVYQYYQRTKTIQKAFFVSFIKENSILLIYFVGFLVSVYSMVISPSFPARAWSGPLSLLLVVIGYLISKIILPKNVYFISKYLTLILLFVFSITTYTNALFDLKNVNAAFLERKQYISEATAKNESIVEIPIIQGYTAYSCYENTGDLNNDSSKWPNTAIARYYGIDKVIVYTEESS